MGSYKVEEEYLWSSEDYQSPIVVRAQYSWSKRALFSWEISCPALRWKGGEQRTLIAPATSQVPSLPGVSNL